MTNTQLVSQLKLLLALALIAPALLGNEGCEQTQAPGPDARQLKRQVELSKVEARQIRFPGAENFDFEYVINAQMYDALSSDDRFVVAYNSGDPGMPARLSGRDVSVLAAAGEPVGIRGFDPFGDPYDPDLCVARAPLLMLAGQVRSFEVVARGGVWFGYNARETGNGSVGGSTTVDVQYAQMEIGLAGFHPLTRTVYGTGMSLPGHTKVDINLAIDFGTFSLGPKFFFQSRLAGVTMRGLRQALKNLTTDLDAKAQRERRPLWETRVVRNYDDYVTVRAGRRHGLRVGDEFVIYNLVHFWEDETQPCRSRYLGSIRSTEVPIALVKVVRDSDLGDEFSRLEIVMQDDRGTRRRAGAQVVVHKLSEPASAKPLIVKQPSAKP